MKRIYRLFTIVLCCFMLFSCKHSITLNRTGSVSLSLPYFAETSNARALKSPEGKSYSFEIILTDSASHSTPLSAKSGDEVIFKDIPLGTATITVKARNSEQWLCYTGDSAFEVKEGVNEAVVEMDTAKLTLKMD